MTTKSAAEAASKYCDTLGMAGCDNAYLVRLATDAFLAGAQHYRTRILEEAGKVAMDDPYGQKSLTLNDLIRIVNEEGK